MSELVLYDLAPSPNNIKVRLALGYKGLPYRRVPVPLDGDRSMVIEVSGQPLTPVLTHGDSVIFDSGAILRYLDANFRHTPRLFSADRETMQAIEAWERWARTELVQPIGLIFDQAFAAEPDRALIEQANQLLGKLTARLEDALSQHSCLMGEQPNAADITAAPFVSVGMMPAELRQAGGVVGFFANHLHLGEDRPRTRAWVERLMAYDVMPVGSPE